MLSLFGGAFLGWGLGANDAANCFGTAVSSRMVSWRQAAALAAVFIVVGALLQGQSGLATLQGLTVQTPHTAGLTALAAALTVALMTAFKLPVSTSQAVIGALLGAGMVVGDVRGTGLGKILVCWIGTPLGAMLFSWLFYHVLRAVFRLLRLTPFTYDPALRGGLVLCGCYGAYALGANNVANVASFFISAGGLTPFQAVGIGAFFISAGVLTFSRGVMMTVGKGITPLDAFSALIVVLAQAVTVHVYAVVGVPVSTSQAVVGAVLGIGLVKGAQIIRMRVLTKVLLGWVLTPFVAAALAAGIVLLSGSR